MGINLIIGIVIVVVLLIILIIFLEKDHIDQNIMYY